MPGQPATPSLVRAINLRTIFDVVHAGGSLSAPEVVRQTGLSRPTVADCMSQLLRLGLIRRSGRARGLPGPGAQLYEVEPRAGWVLSLDLGREWVRSALSNFTGATVATAAAPTSAATPATVITQLRQMSKRLTLDAGVDLDAVDQVVLGTPGVIRPGEAHFSLAPNLPGWESPDVVKEIREALAAPVAFENDINLAAIGEEVGGVARGVRDFVVISIGTGVGMGVVLDGEVRHGASGLAGEIAYLTLDPTGLRRLAPPPGGPGRSKAWSPPVPSWPSPVLTGWRRRAPRRMSSPWPAPGTRPRPRWSARSLAGLPTASPRSQLCWIRSWWSSAAAWVRGQETSWCPGSSRGWQRSPPSRRGSRFPPWALTRS